MVGFLLLTTVLCAGFWIGAGKFGPWLDNRQANLDRYAAERALDATKEDALEGAKAEIELLMKETPIYTGPFNLQFSEVWEGPVLRNRVMLYEQLAVALLGKGLTDEAAQVLWKAQLEYHLPSRDIELLVPWELLLSVYGLKEDWPRVYEITRILAAHGAANIRLPNQIQPNPFDVSTELFREFRRSYPNSIMSANKDFFLAQEPEEFAAAAEKLWIQAERTKVPAVRRKLIESAHTAYIKAGDQPAGDRIIRELWGRAPLILQRFWNDPRYAGINLAVRNPNLMGMLWRNRPATTRFGVAPYMDSYRGDARVQIVPFEFVYKIDIGYFLKDNDFMLIGDRLLLNQNVAVEFEIETRQTTRQIVLGYEATTALGVYPILLLSINDEPFIPMYMEPVYRDGVSADMGDHPERQDIATIDVDIPPGQHFIQLIYLNDAGFVWQPDPNRQAMVMEDRNLMLHRLALVFVEPTY